MAQTLTELYNAAAQVLGARGRLVTTAQSSRAVDVFDLWYPIARKKVFGATHWASTSKFADLPLVTERSDGVVWTPTAPAPGSRYAYATPSDMIRPRMLSSAGHFTLGNIGDTKCLFAHEQRAVLHYTFDQLQVERWENDLFLCVTFALAAFSAMTITGKNSVVQSAQQQANALIIEARNNAANEDDAPVATVASWHSARGYEGQATYPRYLFPNGPLIAVGESASVK